MNTATANDVRYSALRTQIKLKLSTVGKWKGLPKMLDELDELRRAARHREGFPASRGLGRDAGQAQLMGIWPGSDLHPPNFSEQLARTLRSPQT